MSKKKSLTKDEEKVLLLLYERKDQEGATTFERIAEYIGLSESRTKEVLRSLTEKGMIGGPPSLLDRCSEALKEIDDKFLPTDPGYAEHIILLASFLERPNESFLASELGFDQDFVGVVGSRLRSAGIWNGESFNESHSQRWMQPDEGGTAYFLDAAVAAGDLIISDRAEDGGPRYKMTEAGIGRVGKIIKGIQP